MSPKTEQELKREILEDQDRFASAKQITDHEERIRALEKWQWKTVGVHMCVGILVMAFTGICTSIVTKNIEQVLDKMPVTAAGGRR